MITETQTSPARPASSGTTPSRSTSRPGSTGWHSTRTGWCSSAWWRSARTLRRSGPRSQAGLESPMRLKNVTLSKDDESTVPDAVWPSPAGYRIDTQRLGFGSIHTLFTSRQQGFLPNDSDDALWQELKQERFTTPAPKLDHAGGGGSQRDHPDGSRVHDRRDFGHAGQDESKNQGSPARTRVERTRRRRRH